MLPTGYVVQQVFNALVVGSFYSLLAVSYALVHGLTNRIVLSFGDMAMFCAFSSLYAALTALTLGADIAAVLAAGLAGSVLSAAALGLFSLKAVFAPLMEGRSQTLLIASVSLGLVLQEIMRLQSGGREQWLEPILG
ncbi:MAG: ABC transporter permease subunit, partial [Aestuariivirgaceae bacterium]